MTNAFSVIFLAALAAGLAVRFSLAWRQIRHVQRHRNAVPPSFAESISLASHQKAADYTAARAKLGAVEALIGVTTALLLTFGGGIDILTAAIGVWWEPDSLPHGMALLLGTMAILSAVEMPVDAYRTFALEARFGFNRVTPTLYLVDMAKQILVALVLGAPLVALVLWLMHGMGEPWWLYVWIAWMGFNLLVLALYPTLIAPMFNRFSPLADAALAKRIGALLERCGFHSAGLFVMDGSRRSSHGNAYFTGFGRSKRIVFFDTLLSRLTPDEIEAVLAHELGHYRLRHVWKRIGLLATFSLALLWILGRLLQAPWFYEGLGVGMPTIAAGLLLFMLVVPAFGFFFSPLASLYSRSHEFQADAYAARQVDGSHLVSALVKLYQDNASTLTPDPLHSSFYDSHPPAAARIGRLLEA